ncbi:SDR family oxidoreductase [Planctomycetes bacterium SV_7m_r]|uniref:SDR family oxidoreductase n=1 Tax=Stieleria bergensis TaxID=2528025 RepID=UPI00119DB127
MSEHSTGSLLQSIFETDHPVVFVTGSGAARVGRAVIREFAAHGCHVAVHANSSAAEAQELADQIVAQGAVQAIAVQGALQEEGVPESLVRQVVDHFGRLDILVNSAAIWSPQKINEVNASDLQRYFDINTIAPFMCARAAAKVMAAQDCGGAIVNLGDWATVRPYLDHAAYFPSKAGVDMMTRSLAVEFAQWNQKIRVNCVKPGPVMLPQDVSDHQRQRLCESTLGGNVGTAEHVAHATRMLCENTFINGVCLPVDGGRTIYAPDGLQTIENIG